MGSHWSLDPDVVFLNHGSYGAAPNPVLKEQARWRDEMERQPVLFFDRRRMELIDEALGTLGEFVGARPANLGFVTNATEGVTAVARSFTFQPGDAIVATAHAYDAVRNTLGHIAERAGATLQLIPIDLPYDPNRFIERARQTIIETTKLVVVDHITSISALILPVVEIASLCAERGVDFLIDGAHAPGMIDLDVESIGATYYAGNCHKWICAPKGAGFLWVRDDRREVIHPAVISNDYGEGFRAEFGWQGTRDISPWLSVPAAIRFFETWGWERVREHNHQLATWAQPLLCEAWNVAPISTLDGSCLGSMVTVPLPARADELPDGAAVQREIYDRRRIEAPVFDVNGRRMIRVSCQVYNRPHEYELLARAVAMLFL